MMTIAYLVLVPVHSGKCADMCKDILDCISELEGVNVPETVLNVGINDELGQAEDLSAQMEGVSETRFLSLFCG